MGQSPRRTVVPCAAATVEVVEPRLLLTATAAAARPALAVKLGTALAALAQQYAAAGSVAAPAAVVAGTVARFNSAGVAVEAYAASGKTAALAAAVARLGGTNVRTGGWAVDATIPVAKLAALAKATGLRFARPADDAVTSAGAVLSQGDVATTAAAARTAYGLNGAGVTVGVISDSFNNSTTAATTYAADVATGDLPPNVQVLVDSTAPATDEGRAMAQVVYDSAPAASLAFASGLGGQAAMAAEIRALQLAGAKVIVDDLTYLNEPMFQDGAVAQAVAAATAAGVTYVSAAGNNGANDYAAAWQSGPTVAANAIPSAAGAPKFYGGTAFNFAPATGAAASSPFQQFTLAAGASIRLSVQWDSPYYSVSGGTGSANSVDAYVLNAAGTQVVGGAVNADVGGDPIQLVQFTNTTVQSAQFNLLLVNEAGAVPGYVKYVDFAGQATNWAYAGDGGSVFGHANAATSLTVGAANYRQTPAYGTTPPAVEQAAAGQLLSGEGGTPVFFSPNGQRLAAASVRQQPAVVGVDNVDTTFFGTDTDGDGYPNFGGTSAAAAGVAGVAALLLQRVPTLTPAAVQSALRASAIDMGATGVDPQTGSGLVQANAAVASLVGAVAGTVFQDNNGDAVRQPAEPGVAGVTVFADANANGALDPGEASTTTAADGSYALANVPAGTGVAVRVVVPAGYVATAGVRTLAVTGGASAAAAAFGLFPTTLTGTSGNDSYTLRLNPANPANLQVLVGGTLTYEVAKSLVGSMFFNLGGGDDTLTVDDTSGNPVPAQGMSYDGGTAATAAGNALVFQGSAGSDNATVNIATNTFDTGYVLDSNVQSVTYNLGAGDDAVNVLNPTPSGQALTINGGSGNDAVYVTNPLNNNGVGTVFNGGTTPTDNDSLTVNRGYWTFPAGVDPATTSAHLSVTSNTATLLFPAAPAGTGVTTRTLAGLTLGATASAYVAYPATIADRALLVLGTLSIAAGGKIDLAGNDMAVASTPLATVTGYVATGYAGGAWTGPGLDSIGAANNPYHSTALGVVPNVGVGGSPLYGAGTSLGLFDGLLSPSATAVLVRYTYYGDANLDGRVNGMDYAAADAGYAAAGSPLTGWANGDFNFDGRVDGSDYTLLDNVFNTQGPPAT